MTSVRATLTAALATTALAAGVAATAPGAAAATAPDVFSGERNVVLAPVASEGILGLDRDLRAEYAERQGRRNQFVLVPSGGRYLVKTASATRGGEPQCLRLGGSDVRAVACDASRKHQLFSFRPATPSNDEPTWTIRTGRHRYLVQNDLGGFESAQIGEGTEDIDTPFLLLDKGEASLPALD